MRDARDESDEDEPEHAGTTQQIGIGGEGHDGDPLADAAWDARISACQSAARPILPILSGVTDDRAAEPGAAAPDDVADDARFDLRAAPLAGSAPAPPGGTHVAVTSPGPTDEAATATAADAGPPTVADAGVEPDNADETAALDAVTTTLPMWLPATEPTTAILGSGPVVPDEAPPESVPRHRRQPWALLVLSILLALTLGLATYLLLTTRAYERRSGQWEAAARTTGSELTQARADLEATTSDLTATRDQLTTAQTRITQLADEKAKLGDDRALQRQLVDYQQRISAAAGNVATALSTCIDGQYKLIGYLENPSAYDQTDLARFRTDVQTVCGAATDANAALQRELKK
jgi:hypothetical protein